jgi:RNA polymerase sigma-70 factor (ECF subfamily)
LEHAENELLRFPGLDNPRDSQEAENREDSRLLTAIAGGNQQALAALYHRRGTQIYSLLIRMLTSEMEAQEVLQDAFVRIWRRAGEFDSKRSSPMAWMIMIARGLALDRLRSRSRHTANRAAYEKEMFFLSQEQLKHASLVERDELSMACASALGSLPEQQARVLHLAFFRGWTHEEIAQAEGEPLGTVKARIRRGLMALRGVLKDYYG